MNSSRRKFLAVLSSLPCLLAINSLNKSYANSYFNKDLKMSEMGLAFLNNCHAQWMLNEAVLPAAYIKMVQQESAGKHTAQQLIQKDFVNDNIINIDGFILSKYEVAYFAELSLIARG